MTVRRRLLFGLMLIAAWVVMTFTHELGHLIGGFVGGAKLTSVDLAPWRLPYSIHSPDPYPLLTLWAGPILGVIVPIGLASFVRSGWTWLIADFCLLANGCYLALAWLSGDRFLDTARLLDAGTHPIWLAAFCTVTIATGYVRFRRDCIRFFDAR